MTTRHTLVCLQVWMPWAPHWWLIKLHLSTSSFIQLDFGSATFVCSVLVRPDSHGGAAMPLQPSCPGIWPVPKTFRSPEDFACMCRVALANRDALPCFNKAFHFIHTCALIFCQLYHVLELLQARLAMVTFVSVSRHE